MGKNWDHGVPGEAFWREVIRVAKPGAHLLAFGGTRTFHRLAVAIEDAGWEIRDTVMWVYGSGFPKSHNVSKAIDKMAGAERGVIGPKVYAGGHVQNHGGGKQGYNEWKAEGVYTEDAPATEAAQQWEGWGTALKPAWEPIIVARKPVEGTVAQNVLKHGTGAINVDGCRVPGKLEGDPHRFSKTDGGAFNNFSKSEPVVRQEGRFPANLIHDGSDEVVRLFPVTGGGSYSKSGGRNINGPSRAFGSFNQAIKNAPDNYGDTGTAARFFYCAKASKRDRGENNNHPTVKPTDLMRHLCRLVTPLGGTVLDPFTGSGSTGKAAAFEGMRFVGIEKDQEYFGMACRRIEVASNQPELFNGGES